MGLKEKNLINKRLLSLKNNERLFRANSGMGWTGKIVRKGKFIIIENPRPFRGMPEGFPDLFGWTKIEITKEMIGKKIAIFTAEEVKASGSLSEMQEKFKSIIEKMGGVYRIIKPSCD